MRQLSLFKLSLLYWNLYRVIYKSIYGTYLVEIPTNRVGWEFYFVDIWYTGIFCRISQDAYYKTEKKLQA